MPLRLDVKRKLSARSDRVKCVDVHPTEPWMLASLYNGNVHVWNYESQTLVKTFEVTDLPELLQLSAYYKNEHRKKATNLAELSDYELLEQA